MRQKGSWIVALVLALALALVPASHTAQAATYTVTNTNDSGVGSLRQAIINANFPSSVPPHLIQFNIDASTDPGCNAGTGVCTIQPTSALPALTGNSITIDGYTQDGAAQATATTSAVLKIVIDGSSAETSASGLTITSANDVIRGLVINNFDYHGIHIYGTGATGNTVSGNYIGTDVNGTTELGNGEYGVYISDGAQNNTIGGTTAGTRNVISGNDFAGVRIGGSGTMSNTVSGNYIGTNASGTTALGNESSGVDIRNGAQNNTVGGDTAGERNVISGNDSHGVWILGSGTIGNTISGNYIGTDISGTAVLSNINDGVHISNGAYNTVGGDAAGERNVISGNSQNGVYISDDEATGNIISGNTIGLAVNGTDALGNGGSGVYLFESQNTTVGGDTAGERNVISNNGQAGIAIYTSHGNTVSGNYIGTDVSGTLDRGNTYVGVWIRTGAQSNTVGGDTAGERNVISGNDSYGVIIRGNGTMTNTVLGNYIGVATNGTDALGNAQHGVYIEYYTQNNTVGPDNVIAHNTGDGVRVSGATGHTITQNSIFSNAMGIDLTGGANGGIAAPVIVTTTQGSVNIVGTACAGCTVEVFRNSDTDGEGETYIGNTTATAGGAFTVTVSSISNPYLTATATDAISGTSEFSAVFTSTVIGSEVYLPIILRNN